MVPSARRLATLLSLLVPGAGHAYLRAWRRSGALLAVTAVVVGLFLGIATSMSLGGSFLALLLVANVALLAIRVFAVADVARGFGGVALATLAGLVAAPHVALAYVGVRGYGVLDEVFADAEPTDVLAHDGVFLSITTPLPRYVAPDTWTFGLSEQLGPAELKPVQGSTEVLVAEEPAERPWTTILLLGTDEGPGNWGARTDTIILAAIQHGTGRAAAFGIPRNLAQVPLGPKRTPFKQPLNALYGKKGGAAGASAVKQAVSTLLGVRVDYYALVNLRGFADLVDALGGVRIRVKERLVDEVTRPAWGEPKPKIDVRPGEVRRFYGREALAYVRSRKDSSD
ncbi:MAG TPA: LCP family protein, partial [Gaiellaceae bacterium]|nr:LCP family protein [Gaiellaceae bacterium]